MSVMPGPRIRNGIKNVFDVNLHHDPIRVSVEEDFNAKNDGLLAFKGQYSKLMGG
jgi:glycine betaine/choline ABC-type transport system substrate-binding protein